MIGGSGGSNSNIDISKYLINFNASDWANQANQYLDSALTQGLGYSEKYNQAAVDTSKAYQRQAQQAQMAGYDMAQAVQAPQRLAAYGALDAYQDMLGLARPEAGSYQLASALENTARQQMPGQPAQQLPPQQTQLAAQYRQGLLAPIKGGQ